MLRDMGQPVFLSVGRGVSPILEERYADPVLVWSGIRIDNCIMLLRTICSLALVVVLSACGFVSYEDVSSQSQWVGYIGKEYRSTQKSLIYRVSMDRDYGPTPSVYIVKIPPGISGREVLSKAELPIGTTLRVLKVMRCTDCYLDFEERVHMVVGITFPEDHFDVEVQVDRDLFGSTFVEPRS